MKRVALYLRCSTDQQTVDPQRNDIHNLTSRHPDWQVTEFVDAGQSGAKASRPALDRMMADVRRGKLDIVCVWRFDRLARSVSHLLHCLEEFNAHNVEFISYGESIDTRTPIGRMCFTVVGAVAELERQLIIERTKAGQAAARRRGKVIGRYSTITPEQRATVASLRSAGQSLRSIATVMGMSHQTIYRMVTAS